MFKGLSYTFLLMWRLSRLHPQGSTMMQEWILQLAWQLSGMEHQLPTMWRSCLSLNRRVCSVSFQILAIIVGFFFRNGTMLSVTIRQGIGESLYTSGLWLSWEALNISHMQFYYIKWDGTEKLCLTYLYNLIMWQSIIAPSCKMGFKVCMQVANI